MVWGLFPVDRQRGVDEYYIFAKGTYRVGRKDCDVVVQTDTSISRVHAEIVVDEMVSRDTAGNISSSYVRIIDRSKYGTVVNKEQVTDASRLKKDQEVMLKDGDFVTFGTGNATFRFSFVPLRIYLHSARSEGLKSALKQKISAIGAYVTNSWSSECTHVIVDNSSSVDNEILQAVLARKFIVLSNWVDMLAGKTIWTEIPSCMPCIPNLVLDGSLVKLVDPNVRDKLLEGYSFVLGSSIEYIFEDSFRSLVEVAGGNCVSIDEFRSSSQTSGDEEINQFVLVITAESRNKLNHLRELSSVSRVMDRKLVAAILSGHLDSTIFEQPPYAVSSSHSTDETIVADSDVENDTAISDRVDAISKPKVVMDSEKECEMGKTANQLEEATVCKNRKTNVNHSNAASEFSRVFSNLYEDAESMKRTKRSDELHANRHENSDILYSQDLIVRKNDASYPLRSSTEEVNFKRFRKKETVSGNSFKNLIPFSKDPYKESDFGSNQTSDYLKLEKKRKQLEAIAEDLFNNEKASKRSTAGSSLQKLFSYK